VAEKVLVAEPVAQLVPHKSVILHPQPAAVGQVVDLVAKAAAAQVVQVVLTLVLQAVPKVRV
jgi:hypothetical protein